MKNLLEIFGTRSKLAAQSVVKFTSNVTGVDPMACKPTHLKPTHIRPLEPKPTH